MSINVFGRPLKKEGKSCENRGIPGIGFKLTENNDYDMNYKRLCNVSPALEPTDAVNLQTLNKVLQHEVSKSIDQKLQEFSDTTLEIKLRLKYRQYITKILQDEISNLIDQKLNEFSEKTLDKKLNSTYIEYINKAIRAFTISQAFKNKKIKK